MNKILFSAVSKKFVMALAGLFLLVFLPVHLGINLMLLRSDPEPFNNAAHFMATFPLVKVVEILLFLAIIIHITYNILERIFQFSVECLYKKTSINTSNILIKI